MENIKEIKRMLDQNASAKLVIHSTIALLKECGWTKDYIDIFLMKATLSNYDNMKKTILETIKHLSNE